MTRIMNLPSPTPVNRTGISEESIQGNREAARWGRVFAGDDFFYGRDPGPMARRTVRYHRALSAQPGRALDAGCGEGQDVVFLAEQGYSVTGLDFIASGLTKARRLLEESGQTATLRQVDLGTYAFEEAYDLILCVNALQFLGDRAPETLSRLMQSVAPDGIIGLSLFARPEGQEEIEDTIWRTTLPDLLARFDDWQPLEATRLWQWNQTSGKAQEFVTLIARRVSP